MRIGVQRLVSLPLSVRKKALKFGISIAVYTWTLAWMLDYVRRGRRVAAIMGSIIAAAITLENILIVVQIIRGVRSHFSTSTPIDATIMASMGAMIVVLWLANLVLGIVLLIQRPSDRLLLSGLRAGTFVGLVGMALAFLMTSEAAGFVNNPSDTVMGAHSVGGPDGGPGLFLLGWSTEYGDLRPAHFAGIHALQLMPLIAVFVRRGMTRWSWLDERSG